MTRPHALKGGCRHGSFHWSPISSLNIEAFYMLSPRFENHSLPLALGSTMNSPPSNDDDFDYAFQTNAQTQVMGSVSLCHLTGTLICPYTFKQPVHLLRTDGAE